MAQNMGGFGIDLGWLGELPAIGEEARGQASRRSLEEFDMSTPEGMRRAATALWKSGNLKNMEQADRLFRTALAREELKRRSAADAMYMQAIPALQGVFRPRQEGQGQGQGQPQAPAPYSPTGYSPPGAGAIEDDSEDMPPDDPTGKGKAILREQLYLRGTVGPESPEPAPVPPSLSKPSTNAMPPRPVEGPASLDDRFAPAVAPPAPTAPMVAPEPRADLPSDAMIMAAQQGLGAPRGPQLAATGGPMSDAPPLAVPPPMGNLPPQAPLQAAPAPMQVAQARQGQPPINRPVFEGLTAQDQAEMDRLGSALIASGRHNTPGVQAIKEKYQAYIERAKWSPEEKAYQLDRADRWARGLPDISRADWKLEPTLAPKRFEAAQDAYVKKYAAGETQAKGLSSTLKHMRMIESDPNFVSGSWTAPMSDRFQKEIAGFADQLRSWGVPEAALPSKETLARITSPAALREVYGSLSNLAVTNYLGSLGVGVSSTDRDYIAKAFPGLMNTKEGNRIITEIMQATADRKIKEAQVARDYMNKYGTHATVYGLDARVEKVLKPYAEKNKLLWNEDGSPTNMKLRIDRALEEARRAKSPVPYVPRTPESYPPVGEAP